MSDVLKHLQAQFEANERAGDKLARDFVLARPTVQQLAEAHQRKHPALSISECRLAVVRTDAGRAQYNFEDLAGRIGREKAAMHVVEREKAARPPFNPQPLAHLEAQLGSHAETYAKQHGCDLRAARLAYVKTPAGRQLYAEIEAARSKADIAELSGSSSCDLAED